MRLFQILPLVLRNQAPGDAGTGAGAPPPPAAPPAPVAAQPPAPASAGDREPDWLPGRIAQAKRSAESDLLKQLGVDNVDAAKAAIAAAKKREDDEKSVAQKNADLQQKLDAEKERAEAYEQTIRARAETELKSLTPEQRKAVEALAGDDVAGQLLAIDTLKPTWAAQAAAGGAPAASARPADTAPAPNAPNAPNGVSPTSARGAYEDLRKTNPFAAARHGLANPEVYDDKHYAKE